MVGGVEPAVHARIRGLLHGAELRLNGVVLTHGFKGVTADRAHTFAVHQHVGNLIPGIGGDAEGLVAAAAHPHPAVRADPAAMARAGLNGVPGRAGAAAAVIAPLRIEDGILAGELEGVAGGIILTAAVRLGVPPGKAVTGAGEGVFRHGDGAPLVGALVGRGRALAAVGVIGQGDGALVGVGDVVIVGILTEGHGNGVIFPDIGEGVGFPLFPGVHAGQQVDPVVHIGIAVDGDPVHGIAGVRSKIKLLAVPGRDIDLALRGDGAVLTRGGGDGGILSDVGLAVVIGIPAPDGVNSDIRVGEGHLLHNTGGHGVTLRENAVNLCLGPAHETGRSLVAGCSSGEAEAASIGQGNRIALDISAAVGGQNPLQGAALQLVFGVGQRVLAGLVHVRHAVAIGIHAPGGVNRRVAVDVYVGNSGGRCIAGGVDLVSSGVRCPSNKQHIHAVLLIVSGGGGLLQGVAGLGVQQLRSGAAAAAVGIIGQNMEIFAVDRNGAGEVFVVGAGNCNCYVCNLCFFIRLHGVDGQAQDTGIYLDSVSGKVSLFGYCNITQLIGDVSQAIQSSSQLGEGIGIRPGCPVGDGQGAGIGRNLILAGISFGNDHRLTCLGWTQNVVHGPVAGQLVRKGDRPIAGVCIAQCSGGGHIHIIAAYNVSLGQFGIDCNRRMSIIGPRIRTGVTVQLHGAVIHGNRLLSHRYGDGTAGGGIAIVSAFFRHAGGNDSGSAAGDGNLTILGYRYHIFIVASKGN
ncbi:Uncharacterised protein [Flavonifractor plautii]|uniref:Uncharacterized protein n=1 Tax=Flavonifractor plautii TaxID=292800 RepID=A0A6N3GRW3_FLAPL